jgi:hypothetical protein
MDTLNPDLEGPDYGPATMQTTLTRNGTALDITLYDTLIVCAATGIIRELALPTGGTAPAVLFNNQVQEYRRAGWIEQ